MKEGGKHILEILKSHCSSTPLSSFSPTAQIDCTQSSKYVSGFKFAEIMGSIETSSLPTRGTFLGISALVVGGGVAGLLCALELWRHGIDVQIIERSPSRNTSGMYIYSRRYTSQLTSP